MRAWRSSRPAARARTGRSGDRQTARARLAATEAQLTPTSPPPDESSKHERLDVRVGDEVEAEGFSGRALVLGITEQAVEVAIGSARTTFDRARLHQVFPASQRPPRRRRPPPKGGGTQEIDIRGLRADAAAEMAERSLDEALRQGAATLRIIHGKGTGALRAVIAEVLTGHAAVRQHAPAPLNEGGDGVTVAALRH